MLPQKFKRGVLLGLLLLCMSSKFAFAEKSRSSQWQEGPINCYVCKDALECAAGATVHKCEGNDAQSCVIVFDISGNVLERGCSDSVASSYSNYCSTNSDRCPSCGSSGCNDATTLSVFQECIYCDSAEDPLCTRDPSAISQTKLCAGDCMTAMYPLSDTSGSVEKYLLARTCLNDLDLDDQTKCTSGSDANCIACSGAKCNIHQLDVEFHSCYHCEGDSCEDPAVQDCVGLSENTKCYTRFASNNVVNMGCSSDLNTDEITQLIKEKSLIQCDGANCNSFASIPNVYECTACQSADDENCATNPTVVANEDSCHSLPYTQCYQLVNDDGQTERGCLSALSDDKFYDCLTGADVKCWTCSGSNCNEAIIPEDRRKCYRCDSATDTSCHRAPSTLSACPLYNEEEDCVSLYENGVTKRGCASELTCDAATAASGKCEVCSGDGCNVANLKKAAEEFYGIFQELPLNCYACTGDDCLTSSGVPNVCANNNNQDCVTVFNSVGQVVRRGCETAVEEEYGAYCAANPTLCFNCKSNGCNTFTSPSAAVQCLFCDASANRDCLFNPSAVTERRSCLAGCVSSLYTSKTNPLFQDFVRTCFEDIEPDDRDDCTAANNCVQCSGNDCNVDILPETGRRSCYACEGADCANPVSQQCLAYTANDQCYIYFDRITHSVSKMGCKSELLDSVVAANVQLYYLCDGDNCNIEANLPEKKQCAACNSHMEPNCAQNPSQVTYVETCGLPMDECYVRVATDGVTVRGCTSSLSHENYVNCSNGLDPLCNICLTSDCNKDVYPETRQACHRCDSATDPDCDTNPSAGEICPLFNSSDVCVTAIINGQTKRGCSSEVTCETNDRKLCDICEGNNCNSIDLVSQYVGQPGIFQELPLNCYHCTGEDCASSLGNVQKCESNLYETCTTVFSSSGAVVARGCSDSVMDTCRQTGNQCYDCKSNGCNSVTSLSQYVDCIFCDGQTSEECLNDPTAVVRTRSCNKGCMVTLYPRNNDPEPAYELVRTCLDDMDLDEQDECVAGGNANCVACSTERCNIASVGTHKSCYQCSGADCLNPQSSLCRAVMDNDQCFVEYGTSGELARLGCRSDYDAAEVQTLVSQQLLWLCDADNCNTAANVPASQACVLCSSRTQSNCVSDPSATGITNCNSPPYTGCYSRILDDGHTERGCLSSLNGDVFYDCLTDKNATECSACLGDNCNNEVYPSGRLSCHVCSSASSALCEKMPDSAQLCSLYSAQDQCVTRLNENGETERGCSSSLECDATDALNCRLCSGDNCNTLNLKRKGDGRPGLWQELPLTCYTCSGETECQTPAATSTCSGNEYCMTVFGESGAVVRRGCSGDVEAEFNDYCDANDDNCHNCNSNECNRASSLGEFIDCVYCDSQSNADCALNPSAVATRRMCYQSCMTALYPRSENSTVYELARSCLDDKDLEDRTQCQGGDANCVACSTSACNIALLPEKRLSCYSCQGTEACETAEPASCQAQSDDECFILYGPDNDIERMGCKSDLSEEFIADNMHQLYMCNSGDDCNHFGAQPSAHYCVACNSLDDVDCATDPSKVPGVEYCTTLPRSECYSQVLTDGSTVRGCLASLSTTQVTACLNGDSSTCAACSGDLCNAEIFPADRRSCQRCNSKEDPSCESTPASASACPIYDQSQGCGAKLVNGYTYRGCSREFICDDSDKQYCRMCYGSNDCNFVDLASSNIGYPGRYQEQPINCYQCVGDECDNDSVTNVSVCQNNNAQNCATVFATDGQVVQRSCSDSVFSGEFASYCDENPSFCKFCNSNGCNNVKDLADYVDCVFCDSSEDSNCVLNVNAITRTRSCHKECMTSLYALEADSANPAYGLHRSCLDDMDQDDRELCNQGLSEHCVSCLGASCNKQALPETRLKCYACSGAGCEEPVSQECVNYSATDKCYILFNGENTISRMGCSSDLSAEQLHANRRQLFTCNGDECNVPGAVPTGTACNWCNSTEVPECATNPTLGLTATVCHVLPHTECFTRFDEDGVTHRGCLNDLDDDLFDQCSSGSDSCQVCSTNNCNGEIFPANRMSCVRCDGNESAACDDNPLTLTSYCPLVDSDEMCVTKVENSRTIRGCSSEVSCSTWDISSCRICHSGNCNTVNLLPGAVGNPGLWQDLPLSCRDCQGDACALTDVPINRCSNADNTCMTVFGTDNSVTRRGCSYDVYSIYSDYCDENPEQCFACKSNECNNAAAINEYTDCVFCDSNENADCVHNVANVRRTRKCHGSCMVALYPHTTGTDPSYELVRSCLDDMDAEQRDRCASGEEEFCSSCTGTGCNTGDVVADRYSCYKCSGDEDCEDPAVEACTRFHRAEQCYTLYSNESSVIAMGCRSDYGDIEVVRELVAAKQMIVCNGENCNSPAALPTPKECSVCDSDRDANCATNPNLVGNIERCTALPYTECYTRVTEHGNTQRGCISSLATTVFSGCLLGTDGLCEVCSGDKCNEIDVYPSGRLSCHQCSSDTDPECAATPNSNKVCSVYSETDYCVTSLLDGITRRGCATSMRCDNENDLRTCRTCQGSGCNTADLTRESAHGEPGKFQEPPLNCLRCDSEEACNAGSNYQVCSFSNPFENCMTVFGDSGNVVQRGCSDAVEADQSSYCAANPDKCMGCNGNACNSATSMADYVECLFCDSESDPDCLRDVTAITRTRMCHKQCVATLYKRDWLDKDPSYAFTRTCLDDMELDEREACAAGSLENCQACSSAQCNVQSLPATRLSCNVCEADSCQLPQPQSCLHYRADDKCYIRYDENRNVESMGCGSDFSSDETTLLLQKQRLWFCDGDNCNTFDAQPSAQVCVLCNSRTDANCATNPLTAAGATTCRDMPYTQCYSRVLASGATERGCLSSLYDEEFLSCLDGSSATCAACTGSYCNNQVFPADRATCHVCNSQTDPSCTSNPNHLAVCPVFDATETCVTSWENGITVRGCSSSVSCSEDPRSCVHCTGSGCNAANLENVNDETIGLWQDLPLRCLTCSGEECQSEESTTVETCVNNNLQPCVTVFNAAGEVTARGCSDAIQAELGNYCLDSADNCYECKSNECNTATATTDFADCIYCTTARGAECLWDPLNAALTKRKCQGGCMTALYQAFDGETPAYETIRTCLNDKDAGDQTICSSGQDANCLACTGPNCNTANVPETRRQCYICKDDECEDPVSRECPLYRANDQCFTWVDENNAVTEMGCVSSFRDQTLEDIIKTKRALICDGDNCNSFENLPAAQTCGACDSAEDVWCAVNPDAMNSYASCNMLPYTECYTRVNAAGRTLRGCLSDLAAEEFAGCLLGDDEHCQVCSGTACNKEVFPADRPRCFTCSSDDDETCQSNPSISLPCPFLRDSEVCVTTVSDNTTVRGCSSQLYCDPTDTAACRPCSGAECNTIDLQNVRNEGPFGLWQDLPLRCHACVGDNCLNSLGPAHTCAYNDEQDCMTVFESSGEVRRRGCADEVQTYEDRYCRENPSLCFKCKSNECNDAWDMTSFVSCAVCDSLENPLCIENPEYTNFDTRQCNGECMVAMLGDRVLRTCLDDREQIHRYICRSGGESNQECSSCSGAQCNKFNFPADRRKCHVCSDGACATSASQYCTLYDPNDFCFARYDSNGNPDLLGCGTSQSASDIDNWTAQNILYRCNANECNDLSMLPTKEENTCLSCDSKSDVNCAQNPTAITTTVTCSTSTTSCMTLIGTEGNTIRGCFASLTESEQVDCQSAGTCAACANERCNNEIFPQSRRSCHICTSASDESCASNPNALKVCPVYVADQRCVSKNTDGLIERGCESELTCDEADEETCEVCDSNGCNVADLDGGALAATGSLLLTFFLAFAATVGLRKRY